jgi:hypothetical protein
MKELKCFRLDERVPVQNLGSLCSDHPLGLVTYHCRKAPGFTKNKYFLPNKPKVIQCLPGKLKEQLLTKGNKAAQNRYKTHSNER